VQQISTPQDAQYNVENVVIVRVGVCYQSHYVNRDCMGNLGINPILLAGHESQGNRYNYKVYIMLNIKWMAG